MTHPEHLFYSSIIFVTNTYKEKRVSQHQDKDSKSLISRREFIKFSGLVAGVLGISPQLVAETLFSSTRAPILWLHFDEFTVCTESVLRTTGPWFDELIMNSVSLDYHETLMVSAGHTAEAVRDQIVAQYSGEFICVVEGAIPTANGGEFGKIADRTMLSIAEEIIPQAKVVINCGTCASFGGLPAAEPNPTGAKGVSAALPGLNVPLINVSGCPLNPVNLVAVIVDYLLNDTIPPLDESQRPLFAYGEKIHRRCPYKRDYARCLKTDGCKGQWTYANCPTVKFNDGTSFPMEAGHPCIGCVSANFWDYNTPFYE
jgi:[NiFe] hydrogenase small subunit